ncbi:MAG: 50S ribosomal protein L11 [bacterium]|nr:50S ribosomal protein L11 [bacterium]
MPKQTVESLIEGGKATAAPPLGPALGPLGVNIGQVVADINKKTASFKGMQVPVKVVVDSDTKEYEISIGTPPASSLILKEAGVKKGSSNPLQDKVADLKIEQVIKIAKMKEDSLLGKGMKEKVKEIIGTCNSMGILVEGKPAVETIEDIKNGSFAQKIADEKTELSAAELKELEVEKKRLAEEIEQRREEFVTKAKELIEGMKGKERSEIKGKLTQEGIPAQIVNELLPAEEAEKPGEEKKEEAGKEEPAKEEKKK